MKTADKKIDIKFNWYEIDKIEKEGEFITFSEAREYCRINGIDIKISNSNSQTFQIAGAIRDAKKNERKKSAELYKALTLKKIVNHETVYNAILKGEG